jgi:hypothetical protein
MRDWVGNRSCLEEVAKRKIPFLTLAENRRQAFQFLCGLVTILTELSRLQVPIKIHIANFNDLNVFTNSRRFRYNLNLTEMYKLL